jgi:predicted unusual protein kinase regulating ubiquinone biosynthesis (AarF/ABC1/UbiB family)
MSELNMSEEAIKKILVEVGATENHLNNPSMRRSIEKFLKNYEENSVEKPQIHQASRQV